MNFYSKQIGGMMMAMVLSILVIIFLIVFCTTDIDTAIVSIMISCCLGFVVLLLLFYGLFIEVTPKQVNIKFGIGLIKKSIEIDSIESVECVVNKWWYGLGIRHTPHGWMWNISGLNAVEINYKNSKTSFRIGCKDSARLKQEIEKRMNLA